MAGHWRERREYRVGLNGQRVAVSREVYRAWYGGARRERYQRERDARHGVINAGSMAPAGSGDILEALPSGEDTQAAAERREARQALYRALGRLPQQEERLIRQIYFAGIPKTQIARQEGVSESAIRKREKRALAHLRTFF